MTASCSRDAGGGGGVTATCLRDAGGGGGVTGTCSRDAGGGGALLCEARAEMCLKIAGGLWVVDEAASALTRRGSPSGGSK